MKIRNFELLTIANILGSFGNKKMPQKISYAITRCNMCLANELEYYNECLKNIISNYEPYIIKDNDGNPKLYPTGIPMVKKEYEKDYDKDVTDLLNIEIEVDIYTIDENCFNYDDSNNKYDVLSPIEITQLQQILCRRDDNGK